tara:strand:- start:19 stop:183 length:165 start_codon:yes stop_codon:yes gene_type:complete
MDFESEKKYCEEHNWQWTLDLIGKIEKEMKGLVQENKKLKEQLKAQRLYNSCNY